MTGQRKYFTCVRAEKGNVLSFGEVGWRYLEFWVNVQKTVRMWHLKLAWKWQLQSLSLLLTKVQHTCSVTVLGEQRWCQPLVLPLTCVLCVRKGVGSFILVL